METRLLEILEYALEFKKLHLTVTPVTLQCVFFVQNTLKFFSYAVDIMEVAEGEGILITFLVLVLNLDFQETLEIYI